MNEGWISIHRSLQSHWLWADKPFSKGQAWIDILLLANHQDNKFLLGNELVEVKQGSFITSEVKLMERWGWSKSKVRSFLKLLESDEMLIKKSDTKKTTLTVVNYSHYQDKETTEEPQKNHKETTKEPPKDTNNNDNNNNNDNKDTTTGRYQIIIDNWNELNLAQIRSINSNRLKLVQARIKEFSLEEIVQAIKSINNSSFLKGQNKNNWIITFDWFIKPNNFVKVLEGNYLDKEGTSSGGASSNTRENEEIDWAARAGVKSF